MYHAHFDLKRGLFSEGIAADTAVFRSPKHDALIANCKVALASPSSVIVLTGPAGVGKTTLASTALRASSTRLALAWLNSTPTNATELLELLLIELGIATLRTSRIERLQLWRQFQSEMSATDSRVFVVAERTEDLSPEVLRALDSLTSPDTAGNAGANVVLLGQPGLDRHLAVPALDSLRQRIRLRAQLEPFTEAEFQDYLRHQVACADGHYDRIFAPGAVAALYGYSGGVARLANTLCETALMLAASHGQKPLTAAIVNNAAVSLLGLAAPEPAVAAPAPAAATAPAAAVPAPKPFAAPTPVAAPTRVAAPIPAPAAAITTAPAATPLPAAPAPPARAAAPAPPPAPAPATATPAAAPRPAAAKAIAADVEFDGGETDIPDVTISDFPILTDAVELPAAAPAPPRATPVSQSAATKPVAVATSAPAASASTPPPAPAARPTSASPPPRAASPTPAAAPAKRLETAYAPPRSPAAAKPSPPAAPAQQKSAAGASAVAPPAAPKPAAAAAPPAPSAPPKQATDEEADDLLRQTQTMRAISVAKSIDDISSSMAETLFGDAELDLLSAALASAANWTEADEKPAAEAPKPPAAKRAAVDDSFDIFGLADAPLELIDDSNQPPTPPRKTAAQR